MDYLYRLFKMLPPFLQWAAYHTVNAHFLVGVVAVVESQGKVLLTRATYRAGWALPGGMLKAGEEAAACLARELNEELGLSLGSVTLLYASTVRPHVLELCMLAKTERGEIRLDNKEVAEATYFAVDELPPDTSPSSRAHIERYFSLK